MFGLCAAAAPIPSKLMITEVKFTKVDLPPWGCYLVRIDTNQGISGYGEMRDGASATYLKYLKSRIVGENPCEVDRIFRKIKQFGGPARQAGRCVCHRAGPAWDLAGQGVRRACVPASGRKVPG